MSEEISVNNAMDIMLNSPIGEFNHTIDAKGRMNFPTKLKDIFGSSFIITRGFDGCLAVYNSTDWAELIEKVKALPPTKSRTVQRYIFAGATIVEPDKQGRILIPPQLRKHAELEHDVVIVGRVTQAEIWNKQRWEQVNADMNEQDIVDTMEELGF